MGDTETEIEKPSGKTSRKTIVSLMCFLAVVSTYLIYAIPSGFRETKRVITIRDLNISLPALPDDLPKIGNFTLHHWTNSSLMPRRVTQQEHDIMIELLRLTDEVFRRFNITYFMVGGTLIGSYFHHDMVPWDDDLDLVAEFTKKEQIMDAFRTIGGKYNVTVGSNKYCIKFYRIDGRYLGYKWKWPFVDVFLYRTTDTHWWEVDMPDVQIPVYEVFPLSLRPFGPLWLPAPHNAQFFVVKTEKMKTDERKCESNRYSHLLEDWITSYTVPCSELMKTYPFVVERHLAINSTTNLTALVETVQIGNHTVQQVSIPEPT